MLVLLIWMSVIPNYKKSNKLDWNRFTHPIQDSYLLFMKQILLSIELTNNGELEEKGEFMKEGGDF